MFELLASSGANIGLLLKRRASRRVKVGCHTVNPGVKTGGAYYRDVLFSQQLLPAIRQISGEFFIFQQDSAPAYRVRDNVSFLESDTPVFISPDLWPPNSPDLNPVDYKVWSLMQHRV